MTFEEGFGALSNLEHWYDENKGNRNEATTRFRLIDSIFFECLGWSKDDVILEESHGREYTDYVLLEPDVRLSSKPNAKDTPSTCARRATASEIDRICVSSGSLTLLHTN